MADEHHTKPATMDMSEHLRTWRRFVSIVKWTALSVGTLMLFLLAFRAHNG